ncbi:GNAT family N-acetyltransferase [Nocardia takedensis]
MPNTTDVRLDIDDLSGPEIRALLREHLAEMREHSPDGSMHALDVEGLRDPSITMWSARLGPDLVGCGALRQLDDEHAEIKSLRTAAGHTGRGVATAVLTHLVTQARARGFHRVSLETGADEHYRRAIALYERFGFRRCGPFADYTDDPHSVFLTLAL